MDRDARDLNAAGAKPMPHYPPIVVNRAARRPGSRLRVVLLNAAGGRRFREIVACLKRPPLHGADVILLCEVNAGTKRSARRDVAAEIGDDARDELRVRSRVRRDDPGQRERNRLGYMGNAILSTAPFDDVVAVAMHDRALRRRGRCACGAGRGWHADGNRHQSELRRRGGDRRRRASAQPMHARRARAPDGDLPGVVPGGGPRDFRRRPEYHDHRAVEPDAYAGNGAANDRESGPVPRARRHTSHCSSICERIGLEIEGVNVANRPTFTFSGLDSAIDEAET